ncbi:Mycolic acid cyclopropane synthetase-domain-containing protein [Multifurca ochricompacta]|uniref:Mycolic acid cyclopropane synthetase-domain-containing protein n=1 Tax=Multifurca ochricompacta TaxID=376703 RepID=A0AAD4M4C6_9AGAM|nr:Mycolic acid cyclopropane synthetase-domain-containing protein [Multifurca ochricompacta]
MFSFLILSIIARNSTLTVLERVIKVGYLEIEETGVVHRFGSPKDDGSHVHITVRNDSFWPRMLLHGDIGFSEAYMAGDIEFDSDDDLESVMNLWLENESRMTGLNSLFKRFSSAVSGLTIALFGQTHTQARLNAIASYDLSNELYKAFLSKEMMYSCALWNDQECDGICGGDGGVQDNHLLPPHVGFHEQYAQLRKIHHVLRKARVKPGHRILEIGSGWGGLAIEVGSTELWCEVDTLTLSIEQKKLAEERIYEAGLQDLIRVHLMDYREIPPNFEKKFDAFISIEMVEYYQSYFKIMDKALKSRNAAAVITCSSFPEARYTGYQSEDFARKYIWPNAYLPSATVLINAANAASQGRLTVEGVENHASHYARTIREWDRRFVKNVTPELLVKDLPSVAKDPETFEMFRRKWRYLFAYAAAGMERGWLACHMLTFTRAVS